MAATPIPADEEEGSKPADKRRRGRKEGRKRENSTHPHHTHHAHTCSSNDEISLFLSHSFVSFSSSSLVLPMCCLCCVLTTHHRWSWSGAESRAERAEAEWTSVHSTHARDTLSTHTHLYSSHSMRSAVCPYVASSSEGVRGEEAEFRILPLFCVFFWPTEHKQHGNIAMDEIKR